MVVISACRYRFWRFVSFIIRPPPGPTLFPYTTLFRSGADLHRLGGERGASAVHGHHPVRDHSGALRRHVDGTHRGDRRSEEHTSELQSQSNLVCRLLLEKKKEWFEVVGIVSGVTLHFL